MKISNRANVESSVSRRTSKFRDAIWPAWIPLMIFPPAAIAAAVAAQLLIRRDAMAASTSSPEHAAHAPSGASHA